MRRRYNLAKSDNFPVTSVAVISDTIVLEDESLSVVFEPTKPSLVTKINLNFSRGNWLSDITATANLKNYPTINLCSKIDSAEKTEWILSPQAPLYMVPGDNISIFAQIADSMGNSSSTSSLNSSSSSVSSINSSSSSSSSKSSESSQSSSSVSSSSSSISSINSSSSSSSSKSSLNSSSASSVSSSSLYKTPIASFTWTISDGEATITGYSGTDDRVWIPGVVDGYPVVKIGDGCFEGSSTIVEIFVPDGVLEIGNDAFSSIHYLEGITLPDTLTIIGNNAFKSCSGMMEIDIPSSVLSIGDEAFYDCIGLLGLTFYGNAPIVGTDCFGLVPGTAYYYHGTTGWGATLGSLLTECVDCAWSTSSQSSSPVGLSSSSVSSTGDFRVTYEIHYLPLYTLSESETEALENL